MDNDTSTIKRGGYVRRTHPDTGRVSYTGPIRSPNQVEREAQAWRDAGWGAEVLPTSAAVRAEVRAWEKEKAHARQR